MGITVGMVRRFVDTTIDDKVILNILPSAEIFVQSYLGDKNMAPELLGEITSWVGAHMVSIRDIRVRGDTEAIRSETSMHNVSDIDVGKIGLSTTMQGRMAMALDYTGTLSTNKKYNTARMKAL